MPITMNYQQWMKRTYSRMHPRSNTLKALDEAIRIRHEPAAKKAMEIWIGEHNRKNKDWHRSVRNSDGAVEALYKELRIMGSNVAYKNITEEMDDKLAKAHIRREQRLAKEKLFTGKELQFKSSFWGVTQRKSKAKVDTLKAASKTVAGLGSKAKAAYGIAKDIETIIQAITSSLEPAEASKLITMVFGQSAANFALEAAPIIGVASSGAKMVKDWVGVAIIVKDRNNIESRRVDIRMGDPSAALDSIIQILDRDLKKQVADGAIHTAAFTAKGIGVIADGGVATGTVVGAIESIASLLNTLVDVAIDVRQKTAGNKLLVAKNFDVSMFSTCPILGCYYIVIQDDSTIMDFDIENMGKSNWQMEARRLKIAIRPVVTKATKLIAKSRLEIPGMESAKGVYQSSLTNKLKMFYKSKGYGQSTKQPDIVEAVMKGDV